MIMTREEIINKLARYEAENTSEEDIFNDKHDELQEQDNDYLKEVFKTIFGKEVEMKKDKNGEEL